MRRAQARPYTSSHQLSNHKQCVQAREGEEQAWRGLSEYFVDIGCHSNLQVAMYAMDALRQVRTSCP